MTSPFDRAEEALVALEQRTQYDERNRVELLTVHAFKGMVVGLLLALYGPPEAFFLEWGTQTPEFFLWAPAFFGGFVLFAGLLWNRNILLEAIGMCGLLLWDCLMIYLLYKSGTNPYAVGVYAGVAGLMMVHIRTLVRYLRARAKGTP